MSAFNLQFRKKPQTYVSNTRRRVALYKYNLGIFISTAYIKCRLVKYHAKIYDL